MAVHAQYHAFPHDLRAITSWPALDNDATNASAFLVTDPAAAAGGGNTVLSDLTCSGDSHDRGCLGTRKRGRVTMNLQAQRATLAPMPQALAPAWDVQSRAAAASTSGRPTAASVAPVSRLTRSSGSRFNERLRAGLQEARRRHVRTVVSAVERTAARRLRTAEAELERALVRNAELDERLRQTEAEGQAWQDISRSHEGDAAGLRAALDNLVQSQPTRADAEDAQSCCFEWKQEQEQEDGAEASGGRTRACRRCGAAEASVLLLPCRHLCLCRGCEAGVGACPVCASAKNASLHVLLS